MVNNMDELCQLWRRREGSMRAQLTAGSLGSDGDRAIAWSEIDAKGRDGAEGILMKS
jgi:hypothetical protein